MDLSPSGLRALTESSDVFALNEFGGVKGVAVLLDSDCERGIESEASIKARESRYGKNVLPEREVRSFYSMLVDALSDETLLILIGCAVFSLVFEIVFASTEERSTAWIDGAAILAAVVIVSLVQATSNHKQELQFVALNRIKSVFEVTVVRAGKMKRVMNTDLVVGDVVVLEAGDKIPADGVLVFADGMRVDQSISSGESEAVCKDVVSDPFVVGGTHVVEGRGRFLVLCVGLNSQNGRIFALLGDEKKLTPLQEKLEDLATQIGYVGMIAACLTFIALVLGWIVVRIRDGWSWVACKDILTYLIDALTIIVVAVPEGLPLAVTISLAYSMRKMMKDNNFVRRLNACETMGGATVICTDKTGTLTMNQMNVERILIGDMDVQVNDLGTSASREYVNILAEAIAINTTSEVCDDNRAIGSPTETAIVRLLTKLGYDYKQIRNSHKPVKDFQFDQIRKRMTTIVEKQSAGFTGFTKGAPEDLLSLCVDYLDITGATYTLDQRSRDIISKNIEENCKMAYRTLAICRRSLQSIPDDATEAEKQLTLIGIVAIRDSLRPSTKQAIADCQKAGIRVIMVTGDNMTTAQAIARDCGIAPNFANVMSGSELRAMGEDKLSEAVADVCVVARSTPTDKYMIVAALQKRGEVVAVTGDGTNDVAALSKADVGLAMGKCGTELAKEASDIVVLDDDFGSIVKAVLWGRCIFNNVRRFLQFQLTANVVTLLISLISAVILNDTPFKAVQLLWVNLIMDSLGALALATGRPHPSLLNRPPPRRRAPLISPFMIQNIAGQTLFQISVVVLLLLFHGDIPARSEHHYTLIFNVFVYCQMFNLFNARVVEWGDSVVAGVTDNALFIGILVGIGVVEFVLVQFCGHFFSCVPLTLKEQLISLLIASLCVPYGIFLRRSPENRIMRRVRRLVSGILQRLR